MPVTLLSQIPASSHDFQCCTELYLEKERGYRCTKEPSDVPWNKSMRASHLPPKYLPLVLFALDLDS